MINPTQLPPDENTPLLRLMQHLGYKSNNQEIHFGFANMAAHAVLSNDFSSFATRVNVIADKTPEELTYLLLIAKRQAVTMNTQIKEINTELEILQNHLIHTPLRETRLILLRKISNYMQQKSIAEQKYESANNLLDIYNFFDELEHHQADYKHPDKLVGKVHAKIITKNAMIKLIHLNNFFTQIEFAFNNAGYPMTLIIESPSQTICLSCDIERGWLYINAHSLAKAIRRIKTAENLVKEIWNDLSLKSDALIELTCVLMINISNQFDALRRTTKLIL